MAMSNEQIVAVFDELIDPTGWDHPRRWSADGDRLLGGSVQQSRVVSELSQKDPERGFALARMFRPKDQERPASAVIEGLAKAGVDPAALLTLILDLAARGFSSDEFATNAAEALTKIAEQRKGLSDDVIAMLKQWLDVSKRRLRKKFSTKGITFRPIRSSFREAATSFSRTAVAQWFTQSPQAISSASRRSSRGGSKSFAAASMSNRIAASGS